MINTIEYSIDELIKLVRELPAGEELERQLVTAVYEITKVVADSFGRIPVCAYYNKGIMHE